MLRRSRPFRRALTGAAAAAGTLLALAAVPTAAHSAPLATRPAAASASTVHRVLFDDTKAETAGNADWIIGTSMPDPTQQNASPQSESDWTGAISSWGVALQKTGQYSLKTLPPANTITYGNTSNALDLSNFDAFVLPEPNVQLSASEKTAIMKFVQNGGGLFLISDHTGSDRNNDGIDSVGVINDLMTSNSVDSSDPFGFSVDLLNIASENPTAISDSSNPVLNGPFGTVTGSIIRNGTTVTLHPSDNSAARGLLFRPGYSSTGTTGAAFATSTFGSGRVAFWGDSSPIDDGTGQSGNTLYDGWNDPAGTDAALALNATAWLASGSGSSTGAVTVANPGAQSGTVGTAASLQISATDTAGGTLSYSASGLPTGLSINASTGLISGTPSAAGTYSATVTATDSGGASGTATFTWTVATSGGSGCTAGQLLGNPGFETGSASPWTASSGVINSSSSEPPHSGTYDAWLDGYGTATTDTLSQSVTIPAGCTASLSFWLHVDTAETSTTTAYDTMTLKAGSTTLATFSNLNAGTGYTQHTYNLSSYAGSTVTLTFTGTEGAKLQTSFVLDDMAVNVS